MEVVDEIIVSATLLTCEDPFRVIEDGAVAVDKGLIVSAGSGQNILGQFSSERIRDVRGRVVIPGFVDAHTHAVFAGSNPFGREEERGIIAGSEYRVFEIADVRVFVEITILDHHALAAEQEGKPRNARCVGGDSRRRVSIAESKHREPERNDRAQPFQVRRGRPTQHELRPQSGTDRQLCE